jgi:hypothetical protein
MFSISSSPTSYLFSSLKFDVYGRRAKMFGIWYGTSGNLHGYPAQA